MAGSGQVRAAVVGFARTDCRKCHGSGRQGFDRKYHDTLHVIICPCVEMMDMDTVKKNIPPPQPETSTPAPAENVKEQL